MAELITRSGQRRLVVSKADLNEYAKGWSISSSTPRPDGKKGWKGSASVWIFEHEAKLLSSLPNALAEGRIPRGKGKSTGLAFGVVSKEGAEFFEIAKIDLKTGEASQSIRLELGDEFNFVREALA